MSSEILNAVRELAQKMMELRVTDDLHVTDRYVRGWRDSAECFAKEISQIADRAEAESQQLEELMHRMATTLTMLVSLENKRSMGNPDTAEANLVAWQAARDVLFWYVDHLKFKRPCLAKQMEQTK